jgi:hypothetical protein
MRSRRSGLGRPLGDTKASGRRVTRKAPLAHVEGGSGRSEASPTAILKDTHSVEGAILLQPSSMAGCSQAIPSPLLGAIQDMYLDDTHNGWEVFLEVAPALVALHTWPRCVIRWGRRVQPSPKEVG